MSEESQETRKVALSLLNDAGMKWTRIGNGQRFIVDVDNGKNTRRALVKTASKGGAMVLASSVDENATISGFNGDFDDVLFGVGYRDTDEVAAYLVPAKEVEAAYRSKSRHSPHKNGNSAVWILRFGGPGDETWNGFSAKWRHYRIGTTAGPVVARRRRAPIPRPAVQASHFTTIAEVMAWAREQLAEIARVKVDAVRLDLKIEY
jgi:hypothetical protein